MVSSSFGPPGWADPASSTAPDPALAVAPAPPPVPEPVAPEAPANPDVYVRPPMREIPEWTPPTEAVTPAFVATTTAVAGRATVPADRKRFDSRRVGAYLVDNICIGTVPGILSATGTVTEGGWLIFVAIQLIYYFLCEATTGQTVGKRVCGLRVVSQDGTPASAKQVSARTVLRVIEQGPIGLIVMCLTGRRRKRLGDLLAGTVVVDAVPDPGRPPQSPLLVLYPVGWLAGAIAGFSMIGHGGDLYLSEMDQLCKEANAIVAQAPAEMRGHAALDVAQRKLVVLRSAQPARERRALHMEIVALESAAVAEAQAPQAGQTAARTALNSRYAGLGLKHCVR